MCQKNIFVFILLPIILLFSSCNRNNKMVSLQEQNLFTLEYGMFENELRMFNINTAGNIQAPICMEDGMFYIENSEAKKIMLFTSYGDLVQIIYNKDYNPTPSFVQKSSTTLLNETDNTEIITQKAIEYPFINFGAITADNNKKIYVVDYLPSERYKEEDNSFLRQVVLRFKADGTFIGYLGQEGPGGTPFPFIENIYTTQNNELVVVCRTASGFSVFWYTTDGFLKYKIPIEQTKLPKIKTEHNVDQYIFLSKIVPDYTEEKLYLKIDYQVSEQDESSRVQAGILLKQTSLYPLNVVTGVFEEPLIIPPYEDVETEGYTKTVHKLAYDFLGVTDSGWFFFTIGDATGYSVLLVQPNGQKILSRHLDINPEDTLYQSFSLSHDGIISALIVKKEEAKVCWWRTDSIIKSFLQ
ncbi:MAG: hypothetical protein BKP49_08995 [Treponema sp. CETP13]|nr:MAG: hypothetical protein BKP49_08995 [Treponema sp. CETP13]